MRIAQISTVDTPVRRDHSGSIEQIVWLLDRELTRLGHEVTVFAAAGSEATGRLIETVPGQYGENGAPDDWRLCEMMNLCAALARSGEFDVLHSHAYLWGLPFEPLSRSPLVHTLHVHPYDDSLRLRELWPHACVTAISTFQWSETPTLPPSVIIPHGIDTEQFTFQAEPEDYVCFLGRFIPDKGALTAIEIARQLGVRLRLAGFRNEYFDACLAPHIDGVEIEYVGSVTGSGRDAFLGGARALLYPIEAPEPFGLVQVEAMMCGTPVVAMRLGAVPEIVEEGVSGYTAESQEDFLQRVPDSFALDRRRIREHAERRFSAHHMAGEYLALYERLAAERSPA
jgi:glycosyltransferase involved in cell wall biosynthesis